MNIKIIKAWLPVILWMSVIFYFSHQPADKSSELSDQVSNLILNLILMLDIKYTQYMFYIRKIAHFVTYFVLGFLMLRAFYLRKNFKNKHVLFAFMICLLYAISDEIHQLYIPGRSGEIRDVVIDTVGAVCGIYFYLLIKKCSFFHMS